jgi:hypothetical protein
VVPQQLNRLWIKVIERNNFSSIDVAGAEAQLILLALTARLKSCPDTKPGFEKCLFEDFAERIRDVV